MRFTITHQGVPIGLIELEPRPELTAGTVEPLPGYAVIQPIVSAASEALRQLGFPRPVDVPESALAGGQALQRAAELGRALELRDATGALAPTEFIELIEAPSTEVPLAAFIGFRTAAAGVPARERPVPGGGSDSASPAP